MSRASRLVTLDGGDPTAFAATIDRFRRSIVSPRLDALPDAASRRLAIRADRYLVEVALAQAASDESGGDLDAALRRRGDATTRLDRTIEIARTLLDIERDDPELTAEVGLCLAYRAAAVADDTDADRLRQEARTMLELAREQGGDGSLQRKLARQLDVADAAPGTTR
jgi:hypothetical protein